MDTLFILLALIWGLAGGIISTVLYKKWGEDVDNSERIGLIIRNFLFILIYGLGTLIIVIVAITRW